MAIKPSPASISTSTLSFPAQTFAKLSPHPFLHAHLSTPNQSPTRPSGRSSSQPRSITCTTSSLTHASGSAVIRAGDTAVVCGVRAETLLVRDIADYTPRPSISLSTRNGNERGRPQDTNREEERQRRREDVQEMARLNLLVPNVELATGCSPAHLPGGPPSPLAQTLTQRILTLLHVSQLLDMDDLRIWHHPPPVTTSPPSPKTPSSGEEIEMDTSASPRPSDNNHDVNEPHAMPEVKAFWTLYIDILFISLDGNPFDAAWTALLAALANVRLPRAYWDLDRDAVLCDDDPSAAQRLRFTPEEVPVALSFGVFCDAGRKWVLVDMDGFEEGLCVEGGTVVVRKGRGEVVRVEKAGGGGVGVGEIREVLEGARARWRELRGVLAWGGGD